MRRRPADAGIQTGTLVFFLCGILGSMIAPPAAFFLAAGSKNITKAEAVTGGSQRMCKLNRGSSNVCRGVVVLLGYARVF